MMACSSTLIMVPSLLLYGTNFDTEHRLNAPWQRLHARWTIIVIWLPSQSLIPVMRGHLGSEAFLWELLASTHGNVQCTNQETSFPSCPVAMLTENNWKWAHCGFLTATALKVKLMTKKAGFWLLFLLLLLTINITQALYFYPKSTETVRVQ